jgi:hypothetical protein
MGPEIEHEKATGLKSIEERIDGVHGTSIQNENVNNDIGKLNKRIELIKEYIAKIRLCDNSGKFSGIIVEYNGIKLDTIGNMLAEVINL